MLRINKINQLKEKAKNTTCAMVGVNIKSLNLSDGEKKQLIKEGYHLAPSRNNQLILTYSQEARIKEIKNKVLKKGGSL